MRQKRRRLQIQNQIKQRVKQICQQCQKQQMKSQEDFQIESQKQLLQLQQQSSSKQSQSIESTKPKQPSQQNPQGLSESQITQIKKLFGQFRDFKIDKQNKIQLTKPSPRIIVQAIQLWKKRPIKSQNYNFILSINQSTIDKQQLIHMVKPIASMKLILDGVEIENKQAIHKTFNNAYYEGIDNQWMMITKVREQAMDIYEGQVKDCVENGEGMLVHLIGTKVVWSYRGTFVDGKREGYGKENNAKGINYEGEFKDNQKHGKGIEIVVKKRKHPKQGQDPLVEKNRYVGNFQYGYKSGHGIQYTQHGQYQGQWFQGVKQGKGTIKYKKGDTYQGQWSGNCQHGEGTYLELVVVDGEEKFNKYTGQFKEGFYYGRGVMEYWNGDKYDGEWAFGKKEGQGMYEWADGDYYDGGWEKDSAEGTGAACFGGVFYDGEFHLGCKHGLGEETDEQGNTTKAMWQNGKIIKKLEINGQIIQQDDEQ